MSLPASKMPFADLESAVKGASARFEPMLRPGLADADIASLEEKMRPYRLTEEARCLFQWHDGAEEPLNFMPAFRFLSLREAIAEYRSRLEPPGGITVWNPLWFPLFSFEGDNYCIELSTSRRDRSPVFLAGIQDPEIYLYYSDVASLLTVSSECFNAGAYAYVGDWLEADDKAATRIRQKHCPLAFPFVDAESVTRFSKFSTKLWPPEWRSAIGVSEQDFQPEGANCTIAEYLRRPRNAVIHGTIVGLMGSGDAMILEVQDSSGVMTVVCPGSISGASEIQIRSSYEFAISPPGLPTPIEQQQGEQTNAVAERVVPLD